MFLILTLLLNNPKQFSAQDVGYKRQIVIMQRIISRAQMLIP